MTVLLDLEPLRQEYESMLAISRGRRKAGEREGGGSYEPSRFRERAWRGEKEELWRQQFRKSAEEAAEWGRLTRLPEHVVEREATSEKAATAAAPAERQPPQQPAPRLPAVDPRRVVEAAARAGAATKLPEKVVCNYPDVGEPEEEKKDEEREDEGASLTPDASVVVVPPPTTTPAIDKLLRALRERNEFALRPMVELSAQAARMAIEKRKRLDRHFGDHIDDEEEDAGLRIRRRCDCAWCRSSAARPRPQPAPSQPNHQALQDELPRAIQVGHLSSPGPAPDKDDDDDSSGFTEVTVSTNDEQFYPVIEVTEMDRRTSDITFEEASLLGPVKPKNPAAKSKAASTSPSTSNTDPTTQSSSGATKANPSGTRATPSRQAKTTTANAKVRSCDPARGNAHPHKDVACHKGAKSPPSSSSRDQRANRPAPPSEVRSPRRRERPKIEYLVVRVPDEVSTLSMPGYFDDAVERAILDQMRQLPSAGAPSKKPACRVTRFLQAHMGNHR